MKQHPHLLDFYLNQPGVERFSTHQRSNYCKSGAQFGLSIRVCCLPALDTLPSSFGRNLAKFDLITVLPTSTLTATTFTMFARRLHIALAVLASLVLAACLGASAFVIFHNTHGSESPDVKKTSPREGVSTAIALSIGIATLLFTTWLVVDDLHKRRQLKMHQELVLGLLHSDSEDERK